MNKLKIIPLALMVVLVTANSARAAEVHQTQFAVAQTAAEVRYSVPEELSEKATFDVEYRIKYALSTTETLPLPNYPAQVTPIEVTSVWVFDPSVKFEYKIDSTKPQGNNCGKKDNRLVCVVVVSENMKDYTQIHITYQLTKNCSCVLSFKASSGGSVYTLNQATYMPFLRTKTFLNQVRSNK